MAASSSVRPASSSPAQPTTNRNAPRASGSRIAVNAALAIVLVVMGTRASGPSAMISYVLGGVMALSAVALAVVAYRNRRAST